MDGWGVPSRSEMVGQAIGMEVELMLRFVSEDDDAPMLERCGTKAAVDEARWRER